MLLTLLTIPLLAHATTFGPIPVAAQVRNAEYIVHGRVIGASWVAEERESRRPYTHWKLQVLGQTKGDNLGESVVMRQPGGELGGLGYHMAGTARFREGEETFVALKDTNEEGVKEVLGLASGKYTVEAGPGNQPVLRNGLGFILRDETGKALSPTDFTALVRRLAEGKDTEKDRNIFVNKGMTHEPDQAPSSHSHSGPTSARTAEPAPAAPVSQPNSSPAAIEETPLPAEEPKSSWWWWMAVPVVLAIAGAVYLRR